MNSSHKLALALALLAGAALTAQADPTFSGLASGTFSNPQGGPDNGSPDYTLSGNTISFGSNPDPTQNTLTFNAAPAFSVAADQVFTLGSLYYFNGTVAGGTSLDSVTLNIAIAFTDPSGLGQTFNFGLNITTTPNTGDLIGDADYVTLPSSTTDTFNVGGTDYTLKVDFGQFSGDGYLNASDGTFHVYENDSATAPIQAVITSNLNEAFPAPDGGSTMILLGFSATAMVALRRRSKR